MHIDNVTTSGLPVAIHVERDIISKKYDFMMGNLETTPFKIAQAGRLFAVRSPNTYCFRSLQTFTKEEFEFKAKSTETLVMVWL